MHAHTHTHMHAHPQVCPYLCKHEHMHTYTKMGKENIRKDNSKESWLYNTNGTATRWPVWLQGQARPTWSWSQTDYVVPAPTWLTVVYRDWTPVAESVGRGSRLKYSPWFCEGRENIISRQQADILILWTEPSLSTVIAFCSLCGLQSA